MNRFGAIFVGILWFIVAIAITYFVHPLYLGLSAVIEDTFLLILYWAFIIIFIIIVDFIIPALLILEGYKEQDD